MAGQAVTNVNGIITKAAQNKNENKTIKDWIAVYEGEIKKALPNIITPERFTRMVTTAVSATPKLAECTPKSFIGAMLNAAQLGLEPNTPLGQAYLIPYENKKKGITECQFQIGYKGLIDLAYRSEKIKKIEAHEVKENDEFKYSFGTEGELKHIPVLKDRGESIAYYAIYELDNGAKAYMVMGKEDVTRFARIKSKTFSSGPWQTDFDAMAKKTVIKQLLKYAPMRAEFQRIIDSDGKINNAELNSENEIIIIPDDETVVEEVTENESSNTDGAADEGL